MKIKPAIYNGDQLFSAVNEYRASKKLNPFTLELGICDNIVQRYLDIKNPDNKYAGHAGFEEWLKKEGMDKRYRYVAEIYAKDAQTPHQAVSFWSASPSHRLTLEGDFEVGCAYALEGVGVVIVGKK